MSMRDVIPEGHTLFKGDLEHVLLHAEDSLERLRQANIFITGGSGFFGIWLLECLLWANKRLCLDLNLTVLSRSPLSFCSQRGAHFKGREELKFLEGSLCDFRHHRPNFTHFVHAATESSRAGNWAQKHVQMALVGTDRLLEFAARCEPEAVLVTSSGAVYRSKDNSFSNLFTEESNGLDDYTSETMVYGQCKRMIELMTSVGSLNYGYRALIARCFAFVGPYLPLNSNYAIGNFINDALNGSQIIVKGDGSPLRSYLYSADLVIWLLKILVDGSSGRPYNVGGNQVISIKELAQLVGKIGAADVVVEHSPSNSPESNVYLPSLNRSCSELGLQVFTPLDIAIERTLEWYRIKQSL